MKLKIYQVDAFASKQFEGNPAAVVPLEDWLPDELMQSIALENNLAETAFFVKEESGYSIRWFTPGSEVKLCGHATLASAYVLFEFLELQQDSVSFNSKSGQLSVSKSGTNLELDFPAQPPIEVSPPENLLAGLGLESQECSCLSCEDYVVIVNDSARLRSLKPDMNLLSQLDLRGVIVSSIADDAENYDFYARFFAPKLGVPEDPVTGSAYTQLTPYWSQRLDKTRMQARQLSPRGGDVACELKGDRVMIAGAVACYMEGSIDIG